MMRDRLRFPRIGRKHLARAKGNGWLTKKLKNQGGRCCYCGTMMVHANGDRMALGRAPTLEHLTPLSRGGAHHWENVAASCSRCNGLKGAMTDQEFRDTRPAKENEGHG